MRIIIAILAMASLSSCKQEPKTDPMVKVKEDGTEVKFNVADACGLVSKNFVAKALGLEATSLTVKDGSTGNHLYNRSCFYKWDDPNVQNAGLLIQAMANPVAEEAENYLTLFVENKKESGEVNYVDDTKAIFRDFDVVGDDGAYSYEMHKYLWRVGDDRVYTIVFNANYEEQKEYDIAVQIANELMKKIK